MYNKMKDFRENGNKESFEIRKNPSFIATTLNFDLGLETNESWVFSLDIFKCSCPIFVVASYISLTSQDFCQLQFSH